MRKLALITVASLLTVGLSAQPSNPRYGKWKLKSDAPAPQSNIMSYDPIDGGKGMKITIDAVNKDGAASKWGYDTHIDGKDEPLVNDGVNEIRKMTAERRAIR